ncbi:MAG: GGDEF domain-containing protein [Acidiferrobacteraceae bacterium]
MALSTSDQDIIASIQSQLDGLRKTTDGEFLYRLIERGLKRRDQDFEGDTGQAFVAFLHNILGRYAATPSGDTVTRVKVRLIQRRIASHMLEPHPEAEAAEELPVEPIETPVEEIVTRKPTDRDSAPDEPLDSDPLQAAVDELLAESAEMDGTDSPSGKIQEEVSRAQPEPEPEPAPEPARDTVPIESTDQAVEEDEDEAADDLLRFRRVPEDESVPRADPNRPLFADLMDELDLGIPDDETITLDAETVEPDPVAAPEAESVNEEPPVPDMEPVTGASSQTTDPPKEPALEPVPAEPAPPKAKPEPVVAQAKPGVEKAAKPVDAPRAADAQPVDKVRAEDREPKTGQNPVQEKVSPPAPPAAAETARPKPVERKAASAPAPKASPEKKKTEGKSASPEKGESVSTKPKPAAAKPKPASKKKKRTSKQAKPVSAQEPKQPPRAKPKQSLQLQDTWGPAAPEVESDDPDIVVGESAPPAWTRSTEPVPPAAASNSIFAAPQPLAPPPAAPAGAKQDPAPVVPAVTRAAEPAPAAPPAKATEAADPRDRVDKLHETFANKLADSISRSREYHTLLRSSLKRLKLADGARDIGDLKQLLVAGLEELLQGSESLGKDLGATSHYLRISQLDRDLLKDELTRVRDQSLVDDVTGLNNRAGFMRQLEAEIGRTKRYGFSLSVAVLHMEALAEIARKDGKEAVNEILRTYAKEILSNFRGYDCVARIGEHRFGILFPNTQKEGAMTALDKAHKRASSMVIQHKGASFKVPPFTSVLTLYSQGDKPDALLQRADEAFALAREQDRDRIIVALPGN